mmetsp:Transcript_80348/g.132846  ORF Transcript_80348/g.132846 Transcript_80348/m.132846 type:complete len:220 (+) Transcript_80348:672-1331(+)
MRNELVKACHRTDNPLHIAWFWLLLLLCFLRGGRWEVRCPVVLLLHHGSHLRLAWCFRLCRSLSQHWYLRCRDSFDPCLISHLLQLLASLRVGRLHLSRHTGQILLIFCLALVQAVTLHLRIFICLSRLFVFCIFLHRSVKLFLIFILLLCSVLIFLLIILIGITLRGSIILIFILSLRVVIILILILIRHSPIDPKKALNVQTEIHWPKRLTTDCDLA